jgi:hypothetical protein
MESHLELVAAIAPEGSHYVARQALGVQAHGHPFGARDHTADHRDVAELVGTAPEGDDLELPEARGEPGA